MKTIVLWLVALALVLEGTVERTLAVPDHGRGKKKKKQEKPEIKALANPGTLSAYKNNLNKSFYFEVTGTQGGTIWGTTVYTNDSLLSTVAVHAGVLRNGQKGIVKVTILQDQGAYQGSTNNGITSSNYGPWDGSYMIEPVKK
jgi:hypothetical protein